MGNFSEHIKQSNSNLKYLLSTNLLVNERWDWQVTVCFYTAVHIINAHIVKTTNKNYLSHHQVGELINPYNRLSLGKLDEDTYTSYIKLQLLSRRSRYLLNENFQKKGIVDLQPACITYDKHFKKAIYHLDKIMDFAKSTYGVTFEQIQISCLETKGKEYSNFKTV